jgi:hypothetical protein
MEPPSKGVVPAVAVRGGQFVGGRAAQRAPFTSHGLVFGEDVTAHLVTADRLIGGSRRSLDGECGERERAGEECVSDERGEAESGRQLCSR